MKPIKIFFIVLSLLLGKSIYAQQTLKTSNTIQDAIANKRFVFIANAVQEPGTPRAILSSSFYSVFKIDSNSVISNLYYPSSHWEGAGPILPNYGFLTYNSTYNKYKVKIKKNGSTQLLLSPQSKYNIRSIELNVAKNGSANMYITFTNMHPVTYYGDITSLEASEDIYTNTPYSRPIFKGDAIKQ